MFRGYLSVSPFATTSVAIKRPQDYIYHTPVYNEAADEDGNLTNAGEIYFTEKIIVVTKMQHLLILE